MIGWTRRDWAILLAVTALAAALRFYHLGIVPPGFQFDEAFNALDAARVLDGHRPLFLPDNGGREALYTYLQAVLAAVFGLSIHTLRLTSALTGIATVPVCYLLLRTLLRQHSRRVAAFTSLVLAISFWHLHFSHYGIRVILMPVIFSGVFGFFWLGSQRGRLWPFLASGALAGLSVWAHPSGRLVPLVLIAYTGWRWWRGRERSSTVRARGPVTGLLVTGTVALLVFLPLGIHFARYPVLFLGHASDVAIFSERVGGDSPLLAVLHHTLDVAGMFSWRGDREWIHNLAGRPVFDPLLSIPFWLGVLLWLRRLRRPDDPDRDALALLLLWSLIMLTPSVFSDAAPNFSRTLPVLPALFVAAGLGLTELSRGPLRPLVDRRSGWPGRLGAGLTALILIASLGIAVRDYFVRFPQHREAYYAYDVDKLEAWAHLSALAPDHQVYLSQLWAEHATLNFLRRGSDIKSLDSSDTVVLPPPGRAAAYAFPAEQHERAARLATLWPGAAVRRIEDRYGQPLLETVVVGAEGLRAWPPPVAPAQPIEVRFDGGPTLLGMQAEGRELILFWRAEAPMSQSLTSFVHLLDAEGRQVGQVDKLPGNGSYLTPAWSPGERVIERYSPTIDPCAGGEPVRVRVGWYDLGANALRLPRADGVGDTVLAGQMVVPLSSRPLEQVRPVHLLDQPLARDLTLLGYSVAGQDLQPGSPLTLDLYWRGDPVAGRRSLAITLQGDGRAGSPPSPTLLWQGEVVPAGAQWHAGEAICQRLRLRLPADAASGHHRLQLSVAGQTVALGDLTLGESTRRFDVPVVAIRVNATLGEQVRLVGADLLPPPSLSAAESELARPLTVTLTWQAVAAPQASYTVFVHLLDAEGRIVAQSDALPGSGYAANRWLPGEVVVDTHVLKVPAPAGDAPPGPYRLLVGMYDPITGQRLPAVDALQIPIPENAVPLGEVALP